MEHMQSYTTHRDDSRCKAITDLISSVAEEQEALAQILSAEHEKIEKTAEMCNSDVDDLVRIDASVERILAAVTRLELALQLKPSFFPRTDKSPPDTLWYPGDLFAYFTGDS